QVGGEWMHWGALVRGEHDRARAGQRGELAIEQRGSFLVERGERLVPHEKRCVMEERPAERQSLGHAARVGRDAVAANVPETEPLEEHPAPLAPLRDAIE